MLLATPRALQAGGPATFSVLKASRAPSRKRGQKPRAKSVAESQEPSAEPQDSKERSRAPSRKRSPKPHFESPLRSSISGPKAEMQYSPADHEVARSQEGFISF